MARFCRFSLVRIFCLLLFIGLNGCAFKKAPLGSAENPVKLFFVPSVDAKVIDANSKEIKDFLETRTPYKFKVFVPQNFIAVVEAFGSKRADVAALNTFGYILAHEKYGVEARLTVVRHGKPSYSGQIVARADSKINKLEDIAGKKVAFVDPVSTSGYLLPMKMFQDAHIKLGETVFALKHDNVISMVYQRQADVGATFYSPPADGEMQDARRLVKTQYPDVEQKIKIIKLTNEIPNDPIVFRKDLPEEMKLKITDAFLEFVATEKGQAAFQNLYGVTALKKAKDQDYEGVRNMLKSLGQNTERLVK